MKSTIKIDYERSFGNNPVIKITTPRYGKESPEEDIRDKLIKDFLHSPMEMERNYLFELGTYGNLSELPYDMCTISPVKYENILYKLRHIVLNRFVPENYIVIFNSDIQAKDADIVTSTHKDVYKKIHSFFDWLDEMEKARWEK